jgi:hypothetical protein
VLCAAVLVTAACTGDDADRPDGLSAEPFQVGLEIGDCFDRPADTDVTSVRAVPCRRAHDLEVFAVFDLDAGEFNRVQVARQAGEGCAQRFADYIGVAPDSSGLVIVPYAPDRLAWEQDVREVTCAVNRPGDRLEGSVEGSERPAA